LEVALNAWFGFLVVGPGLCNFEQHLLSQVTVGGADGKGLSRRQSNNVRSDRLNRLFVNWFGGMDCSDGPIRGFGKELDN
jgi:hypothetical protein